MPLFGGLLGHIPRMVSLIVLTLQKDRSWGETRHLSHKPQISVARFKLGVGTKKDRTGQDRKKSQKGYI